MYRIVYTNKGYDSWDRILQDFEVDPPEVTRRLIAEALFERIENHRDTYRIRSPTHRRSLRYRMLPVDDSKSQPYEVEEVGEWEAELIWECRPYGLLRVREETSQVTTWDKGDRRQPAEVRPLIERVSVEGYSHHFEYLKREMEICGGFALLTLDEEQSTLERRRTLLPVFRPGGPTEATQTRWWKHEAWTLWRRGERPPTEVEKRRRNRQS